MQDSATWPQPADGGCLNFISYLFVSLLKIYLLFTCMCIFTCVPVCVCVLRIFPQRLEEGVRSPKARDTGGCEPSNLGAENQTRVVWKSGKWSESPSHLSNPRNYFRPSLPESGRSLGLENSSLVYSSHHGPVPEAWLWSLLEEERQSRFQGDFVKAWDKFKTYQGGDHSFSDLSEIPRWGPLPHTLGSASGCLWSHPWESHLIIKVMVAIS